MKIRDHIQTEVFAARTAKRGALVIYDPGFGMLHDSDVVDARAGLRPGLKAN